jgi:hypothetical protein
MAGSGKTTTLIELCRANPRVRFLLVVFNKSVAENAARVFPRNVKARTANSLSHCYVRSKFGPAAQGKSSEASLSCLMFYITKCLLLHLENALRNSRNRWFSKALKNYKIAKRKRKKKVHAGYL